MNSSTNSPMDSPMHGEDQEFAPRVRQLLEAYGGELTPFEADLVAGGLARGRRMRRRRRALWGSAGFTLAAGLTAGALAGGVLPGGGGGDETSVARGADTVVTVPDFSPAAARIAAPAGKEALTGKASVAALKSLLPGAPATGGYQWWDGPAGKERAANAGGRLLVTTGGGRAEATVSVEGNFQLATVDALSKDAARKNAEGGKAEGGKQDKSGTTAPDKSAAEETAGESGEGAKDGAGGKGKALRPVTKAQLQTFYSCEARRESGVRQTSCDARNLADGSVRISYEERSGKLVRRTSDILRKDGTRVVVTVSNSTDGKHGPATLAAPPLSEAQVAAVATSAKWQPWVDPSVNENAESLS
ncbi:hypothetical protein [Streptomyces sp. NPDC102360]|uniref:hypothetical protein n=1 Tax=Streptomyces sp. NPDC102360 TaxID=3366160 RepID=UPI0037FA05E7